MVTRGISHTTQYLYDNNLADGQGLDNAGGIAPPLGGSAINLTAALAKLADPVGDGSLSIQFDATAPGSASVVINAAGEASFTIADAAGRTVMSGQIDGSNSLLAWSCQVYDGVETIAGLGDVLVTRNVDAAGGVTRSLTDGAGRTIQSIDALGQVTQFTYDAAGNQLSVRDPNNVGQDVVYDELGRAGLTTEA